jgi:hypothetical protein
MSLWCDKKYINLSAGTLLRFKWVSSTVANFRCPFCGDSTSSKIKARGYLFPNQQTYLYKCHRCAVTLPFGAFLKRLSRPLFDEYIMEKFEENHRSTKRTAHELVIPTPSRRLFTYKDVLQLSHQPLVPVQQQVLAFVQARQLPESAYARLYATNTAHTWLTPLVGVEKANSVKDGLPYLVIPLRLPDGAWYGAQVRLLTRKGYLTFRWGHDSLRIFGLDAWNPNALTYCVEGPLDALCLPNAIAFCGSDILSGLERMKDAGYPVTDRVLVWDNEPRNSQITKHLRDAIAKNERVVIWRKGLPKDANDMVKDGLDVASLVAQHTYKGITAELEYRQWQK